jgi:glycine dehydrogenase
MIAIRDEIDRVGSGEWPLEASPLRLAPHPADEVVDDDWDRPYPRRLAAFPDGVAADKYWPPVSRIDQAYGDRNVMCSCPPLAAYADPVGVAG